jgi:hypothetical protein
LQKAKSLRRSIKSVLRFSNSKTQTKPEEIYVAKIVDNVLNIMKQEGKPLTIREIAIILYGEDAQHRLNQAMVNLRRVGAVSVVKNTKPMQFILNTKEQKQMAIPLVTHSTKPAIPQFSAKMVSPEEFKAWAVSYLNKKVPSKTMRAELSARCEKKFSASELTLKWMTINGLEAAWLIVNRNKANRDLEPTNSKTKKNLAKMLDGTWDDSLDERFVFNKQLRLVEGQHRLYCLMVSETEHAFPVELFSTSADLKRPSAEITRRASHQFTITARGLGVAIQAGMSDVNRDFASRVFGGKPGARVIGCPFDAHDAASVANDPVLRTKVMEISADFSALLVCDPEVKTHISKSSQRVLHSIYADVWMLHGAKVADSLFSAVLGESKLLKDTGRHARALYMEIMAKRKVNENGIKTDADSVDRAIMLMMMEVAQILTKEKLNKADVEIPKAGGIFRKYREQFGLPLR